MVALAGSRQEFLTKTYALLPDAHALPLSKSLPAVRFPAVSSASEGPAYMTVDCSVALHGQPGASTPHGNSILV